MVTNDGSADGLTPVPLSALQHMSYCPRQCALIHVEHSFSDNVLTVRGQLAHKRVVEGKAATRDGVRSERSVRLWSEEHGLTGVADVVEFHPDGTVYPVEYKHGKRHMQRHDDLQLCGQALCLEEMLGVTIPQGAIYHHSSRNRREVEFTSELRQHTIQTAQAVRELVATGVMPPPVEASRCHNCSLQTACTAQALRCTRWAEHWDELFHVTHFEEQS